MNTHRFLATICTCLLVLHGAKLSASDLVTYQGKLTDATAAPLPDGQYRIGVRIWDAASGGTVPLWARKYDVPAQGGMFSLMIGSTGIAWDSPVPLTGSLKLALSGTSRFVEITVMSDAGQAEKPEAQWKVLYPRQALGAVPFAMNGVPAGTVLPFAGITVPDGWLLCDGASYSTTDSRYAALFATIQTTYGSGSGVFRVPDMRGRTAIGAGQGSGLSNRLLAQAIGAETHTLTVAEMPSHSHSINDPGHSHTYQVGNGIVGGIGGGSTTFRRDPTIGIQTADAFTNISINATGGGAPHNNVQPSLVLHYIIKL